MPASNAEPRTDDIAIRLVTVDRMSVRPVASVYTRGTPREPDLGNLDGRSCVLRSLSAVSSCFIPDETAESPPLLSAGRFYPAAM